MDTIPNLIIEKIGNKKRPVRLIKGLLEAPCWNGHYLYDESYRAKKIKTVTAGRIDLWVDGEIKDDDTIRVDREQVNAYRYLLDQQAGIKQAIVAALKKEFPRLLAEEYASWDQEAPFFPPLASLPPDFDFKAYIGPESLTIMEDVKDEHAYIRWHFRCRWDVEHGFEVLTHKSRVIDLGPEADADKMYQDNGTYEEEQNGPTYSRKPMVKKKWWKFW